MEKNDIEFKLEEDEIRAFESLKAQDLIDLEFIHSQTVTIFDIDLNNYPMQPWQRALNQLRKSVNDPVATNISLHNLKQWFNFNFTPNTWRRYCLAQNLIKAKINSS